MTPFGCKPNGGNVPHGLIKLRAKNSLVLRHVRSFPGAQDADENLDALGAKFGLKSDFEGDTKTPAVGAQFRSQD